MITVYPSYYKDFTCIAENCRHSCCIGWEIDIDEDSLAKYQALKGGYGSVIQESISSDPDGEPHFRLGKDERCPHLNEQGLCRIILNLGEDHLCGICREHPRFYNFTQVASKLSRQGLNLCKNQRIFPCFLYHFVPCPFSCFPF